MTRLMTNSVNCPICGEFVNTTNVLSTIRSGCDLDTRPCGLARSAFFINKCSKCHYVFEDVEEYNKKYADVVNSDEYQKIFSEKDRFSDDALCYFALAYLMKKCDADFSSVGYQYLKAAWKEDDAVCDTENDEEKTMAANNAVYFRKLAIEFYEKTDTLDTKFLLLDLYRRTNQFDKARDLIEKVNIPADIDENLLNIYSDIIKKQAILVAKKDNKVHSVFSEIG